MATKPDIALFRTELKADLRELELRLERQIERVVICLGTLIVAIGGPIRYLPPAGRN